MSYDNDAYWQPYAQFDWEISDGEYLNGLRLPPSLWSAEDPYWTFRVTCFSVRSKPSWWLAGSLLRCIGSIEQELDFVSDRQVIPLNEICLVKLPAAAQETYYKFQPAFWFLQYTLLVERYEVPPLQ